MDGPAKNREKEATWKVFPTNRYLSGGKRVFSPSLGLPGVIVVVDYRSANLVGCRSIQEPGNNKGEVGDRREEERERESRGKERGKRERGKLID